MAPTGSRGPTGAELISHIDDGTMCRQPSPNQGVVSSGDMCREPEFTAADLDYLFRMCLNPKRGLTDADYEDAAKTLGVEVEMIKAVAEVEKGPQGSFDKQGRPTILFERHYFHKGTKGKYDTKYPNISNSKAGGYGKFSAQYGRLESAFGLVPTAALESASWGRFQIMGSNYKAAGFASVQAMVKSMSESEANHLKAFVGFVQNDQRLVKALQDKDWAGFAKVYNGKQYKKNKYDEKLKAAYEKLTSKGKSAAAGVQAGIQAGIGTGSGAATGAQAGMNAGFPKPAPAPQAGSPNPSPSSPPKPAPQPKPLT